MNTLEKCDHREAQLRSRAEQAERERDEARTALAETAARLNAASGSTLAELEQAKADNAALLDVVRAWVGAAGVRFAASAVEGLIAKARSALDADHPGAALLEVANLIRQYPHRDEADLLLTLKRLLEERGRLADTVPPTEYAALLERLRVLESALRLALEFNQQQPIEYRWGNAVHDVVADALQGKAQAPQDVSNRQEKHP